MSHTRLVPGQKIPIFIFLEEGTFVLYVPSATNGTSKKAFLMRFQSALMGVGLDGDLKNMVFTTIHCKMQVTTPNPTVLAHVGIRLFLQ